MQESNLFKQMNPEQKEEIFVDQRKSFRISLRYPLEADMTLVKIGGKEVTLGITHVLLEDIGPGGHRFCSNIRLPIDTEIMLKFSTTIFNKELNMYGKIVWGRELSGGIMQYGVQYEMDEELHATLMGPLNQMQVKLRQNPILPGCRFIKKDRKEYFNKRKKN